MRIAIDYTSAARQGGGIGRYTRELINAVLPLSVEHDLVLMTASAGLGECWEVAKTQLRNQAASTDNLKIMDLPITDDWMARLWQRLRLPIPAEILTGELDVFYSPDFVLPTLRRKTRALLTIHDLSFLQHPETFTPALRKYLENSVPRSVARADHLLADSDSTRQDLISWLNIPPEKISTLYCGVSEAFAAESEPQERIRLKQKYNIGDRPYILSLGTVHPRKNYRRLMEACDPLAKTYDLDLIIVGKPAWLADPIIAAAQERPYVQMMGFLDDADLPALYRQATIMAYPSLYEGFGIPPLEAMKCGTPVVASTAPSLPEVLGDAALLVDPLDTPGWTEALKTVLDKDTVREELRAKGLRQVSKFTWTQAAQRWLSVVQSMY